MNISKYFNYPNTVWLLPKYRLYLLLLTTFFSSVTLLSSNEKPSDTPYEGDLATTRELTGQGADLYLPTLQSLNHQLLEAALKGDLEAAKKSIEQGADINCRYSRDEMGQTPLSRSIEYGHPNIAKLLLDKGADPNKTDKEGIPPLVEASIRDDSNAIDMLIRYGADVDISPQIYHGRTALMQAAYWGGTKAIKALLQHNADPNKQETDGKTALINAVLGGKKQAVQELLEANASLSIADKRGKTPLDYAKEKGLHDITKIIETKMHYNASYKKIEILIRIIDPLSSKNKYDNINKILQKHPDIPHTLLLLTAIEQDKEDAIKYFLKVDKINIDATNQHGYSALSMAVAKNKLPALRMLLKHGAKTTGYTSHFANPIYIAIKQNNKEALEILLNNDPSLVNARIKIGKIVSIPLQIASEIGSPKIVRLFIERGANPNEIVKTSPSPLLIATNAGNKTITEELLKLGAKPLSESEQNLLSSVHKKQYQAIRKTLKKRKRRNKTKPIALPQKYPTQKKQGSYQQTSLPTLLPTQKQKSRIEEAIEQKTITNTIKLWELVNQGKAKQVNEQLSKMVDLNFTNKNENILANAVKLAIQEPKKGRRVEAVKALLSHSEIQKFINDPDLRGKTLIQKATDSKHTILAQLLADYGAQVPFADYSAPAPPTQSPSDLDKKKSDGSDIRLTTQPTKTVTTTNDSLFAELKKGNRAKIKTINSIVILDPGTLTKQRAGGKTPLMHAIESNVTEQLLRDLVNQLTPEHINLEEQTKDRDSALTKAIRGARAPFINYLLEHGAIIQAKDIDIARRLHDKEQRADNQIKARRRYTILKDLERAKQYQDANKKLLEAAESQMSGLESIKEALALGADINTQDAQGNTPLIRAIMAGNTSTAQSLIERKAHLNIRNNAGKTTLFFATTENNYPLVDYLLQHNADEKVEDNSGATVYGYATTKGYTDIANRILTYKALKNLKKSDTITHVLNRHTILGKNKKPKIIKTDQNIQSHPYMAHYKDGNMGSFFPQSWSPKKIKKAIESILKNPEQLYEQPAKITEDNKTLRSALILKGTYDSIPIKVVISDVPEKGWIVFTAYPIQK